MRRLEGLGTIAVAAVAVIGCGGLLPTPAALAIPTLPASAVCDDALLSGRLVVDDRWVLALDDGLGVHHKVTWPFGFSARQDGGRLALVDRAGLVVAHVGDLIQGGGGVGSDNDPDHGMVLCDGIRVQ